MVLLSETAWHSLPSLWKIRPQNSAAGPGKIGPVRRRVLYAEGYRFALIE